MTNDARETELVQNVGQLLKHRRQKMKLSLAEVEVGTRIRGKYLVKLEGGAYDELPNDIYTRGFVVSYGNFLGLDGNSLARQYAAERGGDIDTGEVAPKPVGSRRWVFTPPMLAAVGILAAAVAVVTYLSYQFSALAAPPKLELQSPVTDQVINGSLIDVTGHVTPGADVFINDSSVLIDANSNFDEKLALQDGVNTIRITAKNKLGKTTTVNRNILAHLPQLPGGRGSVPPTVFDGVAIDVSIKNTATALMVKVDGKEVFRGTMLAGTVQDFRGSRIELTTSNAGATYVKVTNQNVAAKDLGAQGNAGELRQDVVFAKDTQFQ